MNNLNICIIPARGGSVGIPKKNLLELNGIPLIGWSIRQAIATSSIDLVVVSTDAPDIAEYSKSEGAVVVKRPKALSDSTSSSEEALLHSLKKLELDLSISPATVTFLQATSPLRKPDDIKNALKKFKNSGADSLFSVCITADLTLWNLVDGKWRSVNFDYQNRKRRQDAPTQYIENGSIYIIKSQMLVETQNRIGGKIETFTMEPWQVHEIDTLNDAELVEYLMRKHDVAK
jgi:CMP-N,N'-diacetyllegionaminic acid synthase